MVIVDVSAYKCRKTILMGEDAQGKIRSIAEVPYCNGKLWTLSYMNGLTTILYAKKKL
jgi:hypothetical protein